MGFDVCYPSASRPPGLPPRPPPDIKNRTPPSPPLHLGPVVRERRSLEKLERERGASHDSGMSAHAKGKVRKSQLCHPRATASTGHLVMPYEDDCDITTPVRSSDGDMVHGILSSLPGGADVGTSPRFFYTGSDTELGMKIRRALSQVPPRVLPSLTPGSSGSSDHGGGCHLPCCPTPTSGSDNGNSRRSGHFSSSRGSKALQHKSVHGRRARQQAEECEEEEPPVPVYRGWDVSLASSSTIPTKTPKYKITLLKSAFAGRPPVLFFNYHESLSRDTSRVYSEEELQELGFAGLPKMFFCYEVSKDCHEYNAVVNTLRVGGLHRVSLNSVRWLLYWGTHPSAETLRSFNPFQKTNHFPASWNLGRKDLLWRNVARMKRQFPQHYDIMPAGFVLPDDYPAWASAREQNPGALWIWKPVNSACGRGIRLFNSTIPPAVDRKLSQKQGVVQRYIDKPLLINGFKFDLRVYIVVTSYDPLKVYINSEGLVRLATEKYQPSADNLGHRTMHLTNYSVNKHSEKYKINFDGADASEHASSCTPEFDGAESGEDMESDAEGNEGPEAGEEGKRPAGAEDNDSSQQQSSKWSYKQLRDYMEGTGQSYDLMMRRLKDLVIKTVLAVEPRIVSAWHSGANFSSSGSVPRSGPNQTCFEIYGFDVMIDSELKPWLLEVNIFPSLSSSSPFDKRIKTQLIADTLTMVGLMPFDPDLLERATKEEAKKRLQGLLPKAATMTISHNVSTLQSVTSLRDLGEAEWRIILDAHDEYMRRGSFERIFPLREGLELYGQFFSTPRYSNLVLARWLEAGGANCFRPEASSDLPLGVPRQIFFNPC